MIAYFISFLLIGLPICWSEWAMGRVAGQKGYNFCPAAAIDQLAKAASDLGVSTAGLALGWLHNHPDVTAPIIGPRRPEHFGPVEEAMGLALSAAQ